MDIQMVGLDGSTLKKIEINVSPEEAELINVPLLQEIVRMQRAGIRSGTASTKTRGEVSGGGKKPYRQKGTGRARQGSTRAPQWRGGAIIFGPRPRDYFYRQPAKKVVLAVKNALLAHLESSSLFIVDSLDVPTRKTKETIALFKKWSLAPGEERILFVDNGITENMYFSCRNIPGLEILLPHQVNPYDLLIADKVLVSKDAFESMNALLLGENTNGSV